MLLLLGLVQTLLCYRWSSSLRRLMLVYNLVNGVVNVHFEQLSALTSYQIFKIRFFSFLRVHLLKLFSGYFKTLSNDFNLNLSQFIFLISLKQLEDLLFLVAPILTPYGINVLLKQFLDYLRLVRLAIFSAGLRCKQHGLNLRFLSIRSYSYFCILDNIVLDIYIVVLLELVAHELLFMLEMAVPVVFDRVVRAPLTEDEGDDCPTTAIEALQQEQCPLFFFAPIRSLDQRIQIIVPALPALLRILISDLVSDLGPVLSAVQDH